MSELQDLLIKADDLGAWRDAVIREQVIRDGMAQTGETRETVTEFVDAHLSMADEAVLDLMEGEPTTLRAGLQRYVDGLDTADPQEADVADDLGALLAYPWPVASAGPGLEVERPDDETLIVKVGGQVIAGANHDDHGWAGMDLLETTARNVYNAAVGG